MNPSLDADGRKLFVGDISKFCSENELAEAFSVYGQLADVIIKRSKDLGHSLNYGFVTFLRQSEASAALHGVDGLLICGRKIRVRWAVTSKLSGSSSHGPNHVASVHARFVSSNNTSTYITEEELNRAFSVFGNMTDIVVKESKIEKFAGRQTGYAFVHFSNDADGLASAMHALQVMNDSSFEGISYTVRPSKSLATYLEDRQTVNADRSSIKTRGQDERGRMHYRMHDGEPVFTSDEGRVIFERSRSRSLNGFSETTDGDVSAIQSTQTGRSTKSPQTPSDHFSDQRSDERYQSIEPFQDRSAPSSEAYPPAARSDRTQPRQWNRPHSQRQYEQMNRFHQEERYFERDPHSQRSSYLDRELPMGSRVSYERGQDQADRAYHQESYHAYHYRRFEDPHQYSSRGVAPEDRMYNMSMLNDALPSYDGAYERRAPAIERRGFYSQQSAVPAVRAPHPLPHSLHPSLPPPYRVGGGAYIIDRDSRIRPQEEEELRSARDPSERAPLYASNERFKESNVRTISNDVFVPTIKLPSSVLLDRSGYPFERKGSSYNRVNDVSALPTSTVDTPAADTDGPSSLVSLKSITDNSVTYSGEDLQKPPMPPPSPPLWW